MPNPAKNVTFFVNISEKVKDILKNAIHFSFILVQCTVQVYIGQIVMQIFIQNGIIKTKHNNNSIYLKKGEVGIRF